jgi:hypothetical protein
MLAIMKQIANTKESDQHNICHTQREIISVSLCFKLGMHVKILHIHINPIEADGFREGSSKTRQALGALVLQEDKFWSRQ